MSKKDKQASVVNGQPRRIRRMEGIRLLPSGRWQLRWHRDGKNYSETLKEKCSEREAVKIRGARMAAQEAGDWKPPSKVTVGDYADRWLAARKVLEVNKRSTIANYRTNIEAHIKPRLGKYRLTDLTPVHVKDFYLGLKEAGKEGRTCKAIGRVLDQILDEAARVGVISKNPHDALGKYDLPRAARREKAVLTQEQTVALLEAAQGTNLYPAILLGMATGPRRGEILGARWGDINWEAGTITIERQVLRDGGETYEAACKTEGSAATLQLPPFALAALHPYKGEAHERIVRGINNPQWLSTAFRQFATKQGYPGVTPHSLRHGVGTHLQAAGCDVKDIQSRLRHRSIQTTLDTYVHANDASRSRTTAALELAYSGHLARGLDRQAREKAA